jgi:hypothetical protein
MRQGPGSERHVDTVFTGWLVAHGWTCKHARSGHDDPDIDAWHPDHGRLIVEVKGYVSDNGASLDIGYGQLLRRMSAHPEARFALVVARAALRAALRVSAGVRTRLGIELYVVDLNDEVHRCEDGRADNHSCI